MSNVGDTERHGETLPVHDRGRAHELGDQEAIYGCIQSSVFVDARCGDMEGHATIGTRNPEEHVRAAEATRFFCKRDNYSEELTYDALPYITEEGPEQSRLDMAT